MYALVIISKKSLSYLYMHNKNDELLLNKHNSCTRCINNRVNYKKYDLLKYFRERKMLFIRRTLINYSIRNLRDEKI